MVINSTKYKKNKNNHLSSSLNTQNTKKTTIYTVRIPGTVLRQAQQCGEVTQINVCLFSEKKKPTNNQGKTYQF